MFWNVGKTILFLNQDKIIIASYEICDIIKNMKKILDLLIYFVRHE